MELGLKGKRVLVTGGSKGIGLACAAAFLAEGADVAICSRSQHHVDLARERYPALLGLTADLIDASAAETMLTDVEARLGNLDIVVNSAGAARRTPPDELTPQVWRAAFDAKFFSYINVIDPVVKRMATRGHGVIINIIGAGGKIASSTHLAGGSANSALMLATAGLGTAYASRGIRVVGINPGLTDTERVAEGMIATAQLANISSEEARQRSIAGIPLGRMATPEEIASVAVYLSSSQASYVTATTLSMDGGQYPSVV